MPEAGSSAKPIGKTDQIGYADKALPKRFPMLALAMIAATAAGAAPAAAAAAAMAATPPP
jgi:hypothetical protein